MYSILGALTAISLLLSLVPDAREFMLNLFQPQNVYMGTTDMAFLNATYPEYFNQDPATRKTEIPRTLILTWKDLKEIPEKVMGQWHDHNPDFRVDMYDDKRIVDFLKQEYNETYVKFFDDIKLGRHKADFFRYCYLYKRGGIYADIDLVPMATFDSFIHSDTQFFTVRTGDESIFQAYLASVPYHPIMRLAIHKMMKVGPLVGVDPPEERPFTEDHPTVGLYRIIENLLGTEPKPGRWDTSYGPLQLALEETRRSRSIFRFILPKGRGPLHVYYGRKTVAISRTPDYNQETGFVPQESKEDHEEA